ncbi:MAG: TonB-dependent receptor [Bacteroidales bacterium]
MLKQNFYISLLLIICIGNHNVLAQTTQTIRGVVVDRQSGLSLPGVNVYIEGSEPLIGTATDFDGKFIIKNVPYGRYNIVAQYVGYEMSVQSNVQVGSGRQVEINFSIQENSSTIEGVVVSAKSIYNETINSMSMISGRTFSVEETRRFAGGMDDPARMVSAYAGVSTGNPQDNAIIIRGNNPKYVSWHLEGVEIPNPNHFSSINVIGGGFVTIFSNQLLANSDFYTGAFAAEYGNAISGVFDMRFRSGNNHKREYTFQAGVMGIDFAVEGPFVDGKNSSYLANYRYSTMSLISPLIPSTQVPKYQDLSFKLNFPTQRQGTFAVWGIGAIDGNIQPIDNDSTEWVSDFSRMGYDFTQRTSAAGFSHRKIFGTNTFVNTSLVASVNQFIMDMKRVNNDLLIDDNWYGNNMEGKYTLKSFVNHKFSEWHTNRTGIVLNNLFYKLENRAALNNELPVVTLSDEDGSTNRFHAFTQSQLRIGNSLRADLGVHTNYLQMNNEFVVEPRLGINYSINKLHRVGLGYGLHSSMEPLRIYFFQTDVDGFIDQPNKSLKLTKAHHLIASYDWAISPNLRIKVEPYYQQLFDVPVIADSVYSMINFEQDFYFNNTLTNQGKGKNYGVDLTFEKFFHNSIYYLITTSFFKSDYETSSGEVYPTRYDKGYVVNLLGGKEFTFKKKNRNTISLNGRLTISGGNKITPINFELSNSQRSVIHDWSRPFADQNPIDYYLDFTMNWRIDRKKIANIFSFQVMNMLGNPSGYQWTYNYRKQEIELQSVVVVVPNFSYRIEF